MSSVKITMQQLETAYKAATDGYMKAYGQVHDTPVGKMCWMGRISRASDLMAKANDDAERSKMKKGVKLLTEMAEKDFVSGELAYANYVDLCKNARIEPMEIDIDCQCERCQREPTLNIMLFAA